MEGKVLQVWTAHRGDQDVPDKLHVIVRLDTQRIYYADYFISLGAFDIKNCAEEDAMWILTFDPANPDKNITTAMWVPVDSWLERYSPEMLKEEQKRRERLARFILFAALAILLIAAVVAIATPGLTYGDYGLLFCVLIVLYTANEFLVALKEWSRSLVVSAGWVALLVFVVFSLLGTNF